MIELEASPEEAVVVGSTAFVTLTDADAVAVVDLDDASVETMIDVGDGPFGIAYDGTMVAVANGLDGTLSLIDPNRMAETIRLEVGVSPYGVSAGSGQWWIADLSGGNVLSVAADGSSLGTPIPVDGGPFHVVELDASHVAVTSFRTGDLVVLDIGTDVEPRRHEVGDEPAFVSMIDDHIVALSTANDRALVVGPDGETRRFATDPTPSAAVGVGDVLVVASRDAGSLVALDGDLQVVGRLARADAEITDVDRWGTEDLVAALSGERSLLVLKK